MKKARTVLESPFPQRISATRDEVNHKLHISNSLSYCLFRPHVGATVLLRDVWAIIAGNARKGAKFDPALDLDHLLSADECQSLTGWTRKMVFRVVSRAPHFRLSRKTLLIKESDFREAVEKAVLKIRHRQCRRVIPPKGTAKT